MCVLVTNHFIFVRIREVDMDRVRELRAARNEKSEIDERSECE